MYMLPLTQQPSNSQYNTAAPSLPSAHASIYSKLAISQPAARRVAFLSAAFGNCADSTLLNAALQGHLNTFPNITPELIRKYAPHSIETAKGHMDQTRQGIWPTRTDDAQQQPSQPTKAKSKTIVVQLMDHSTIHGDSTGNFPTTSRPGHKKILIAYSECSNYIKSTPMKGDSSDDLITAYHEAITFFRTHGDHSTMIRT